MRKINYLHQTGNSDFGFAINSFSIEKEIGFCATPNNHFELIISPVDNKIGSYTNHKSTSDVSNSIVGISTSHSKFVLQDNAFGFHIRLSPQQVRRITDIPFDLVNKEPIALEYIFGKKYDDFLAKLADINDQSNQSKFIEFFLTEHIRSRSSGTHLLDVIKQHNNISTVKQIQQIASFTERGLERYFLKNVGISARDYLSIDRFNQVCLWFSRVNDHSKDISFFKGALEKGYYDQSHFIKCCKRYTGLTPEKFFKGYESLLSGTYNF